RPAAGLDDEPRRDPAAAMGERGIYGLVAPPSLGHDDAAARRDLSHVWVDGRVPGAASGAEVLLQVVEASARESAVGALLEARVAVARLELEDFFPQVIVSVRIERADLDLAVLARVRLELPAAGDETDGVVEVVAAVEELRLRAAGVGVDSVP